MARIKTRTAKDGTPRYTVEVRLKGYPPETATFKRKTDVTQWIQSTESALREGRHFKTTVSKKHTLADVIDRYLKDVANKKFKPNELRVRLPILAWWKSQIGYCTLADLSDTDFSECRDTLRDFGGTKCEPLAADTIHRYFLTLSNVLNICAVEWKWIAKSPLKDSGIEMPTKPDGIVRYLDDDELSRLSIACKDSRNKQLHAAVMLAVSTGMRRSEISYLYWRKPTNPPEFGAWGVVNLADKCIILETTKNGKPRRVSLAGVALQELIKLSKIRRIDTDLVFHSPSKPDQPIDFTASWTTARRKADIKNFRWHDLRHTTASYIAMDGGSLLDIAAVTGHKSLDMVQRYAHLSESHVSKVVESMNKRIKGS